MLCLDQLTCQSRDAPSPHFVDITRDAFISVHRAVVFKSNLDVSLLSNYIVSSASHGVLPVTCGRALIPKLHIVFYQISSSPFTF